jgi:membrane-bound lytic murein transglycosylase D
MIAITARNHKVPMRAGYDGRLSPVDSTAAAVRYLKTLYGMFAGDWRLAVMAYNAGEYRVLGALKRGGQTARNAHPENLPGLSPITHAYVRKLHALSCLLEQADDRDEWLQALDRPVPALAAITLPDGVSDIAAWARRSGRDAGQVQRLNPAFADGRIARGAGKPVRLLATAMEATAPAAGALDIVAPSSTSPVDPSTAAEPSTSPADPLAVAATPAPESQAAAAARRHTVVRGDSASKIASRYGVQVADLLERNGLRDGSVLRPGTVLLVDAEVAAGETPPASAGTP